MKPPLRFDHSPWRKRSPGRLAGMDCRRFPLRPARPKSSGNSTWPGSTARFGRRRMGPLCRGSLAAEAFADMASTLLAAYRRDSRLPELASGGIFPTATCTSSPAGRWNGRSSRRGRSSFIRQQGPDGAYRYRGEYARGHFEEIRPTASARPAAMLQYAYVTGDRRTGGGTQDARLHEAVSRAARRQVWEVPCTRPTSSLRPTPCGPMSAATN